MAGGGRPRGVGRTAGLGHATARCASSRTGGAGGSPMPTPGGPATARRPRALTDVRGRVPRARLGARSDDHGRAGRRHGRRPHDRVRAATRWSCWCPADRARRRTALRAAVCLDRRALRRTGTGWRSSAARRTRPPNVWVWTPDGATPGRCVRRPRSCSGAGDVAAGGTVHADRALRARRARHAVPADAARDDGLRSAAAPPLVTWCHGGPTSSCQAGFDLDPAVLHDPRLRRGLRRLCAGAPGTGAATAARCGASGASPTPRTASMRRATWRRGATSTRTAWPIRGGSAGGMTALNALAAGEGFAACASWYGVTDLMGLVATTHDFEAHYTDRLIGPLPEARPLYDERSPVNRAASMKGSVLLLQGTEDPVVPPAQAESMRARPRRRGHPLRPAVLRRRGTRLPAGGHPDRVPGGRAGLLPRGAPPLDSRQGPPPGSPRVRGFRDAMPTNSATTIPTWAASVVATGSLDRANRISPEAGDALLYRGSALFALLTIYTSTNALYQVWGRMALSPFAFGALASAVLAWVVRARPAAAAGPRPDEAAAPAGLADPDRRRRVRVRGRAGHPARARDPVALRRRGRVPPAARGRHGRGRRPGPRPRPGSLPPAGAAAARGQVPRPRRTRLRGVPALPAAHGGGGHPERDLAQQRAE